jgi:hypothetical protein
VVDYVGSVKEQEEAQANQEGQVSENKDEELRPDRLVRLPLEEEGA